MLYRSILLAVVVLVMSGCGQSDSSDGGAGPPPPTCNCQPGEVCCQNFGFCCPSDHPYGCAGGDCYVTPPVCIPHGYEYCGH